MSGLEASPVETQWNLSLFAVTYSWVPRLGSSRHAGGTGRNMTKLKEIVRKQVQRSLSLADFLSAVNGWHRMANPTLRRPRKDHSKMKK